MAEPSLPADMVRRIAALETQVANLARSQNPVKPSILDLNDVAGVPTTDKQVLVYSKSTGQWSAGSTEGGFPGQVVWSARSTAPTGQWLFANGAAVSRTTYADLFAAIGTSWGAGDGSTTFNVPNLLDRFPLGAGGSHAVGATGGSADSITVSHSHAQNVSANTGGGTAVRADFQADITNGGAFAQGINTGSAGSSGTGANLPPYASLYAYIRY